MQEAPGVTRSPSRRREEAENSVEDVGGNDRKEEAEGDRDVENSDERFVASRHGVASESSMQLMGRLAGRVIATE